MLEGEDMKGRVVMLIMLAAILSGECKKELPQEVSITVQNLIGDVRIVTAKGEKPASVGDVLRLNDGIVTAASSMADINFGDQGVIRIFENSDVKIVMLEKGVNGEGLRLAINHGKMFVILSKLSKGSTFTTDSPTLSAAVRGTAYSIMAGKGGSSIAVYQGSVAVSPVKNGEAMKKNEITLDVNKKIVLNDTLVDEVVAGKKRMEAVPVKPDERARMKDEIKDMRINEKLKEEVRVEYKELLGGADSASQLKRPAAPVSAIEQPTVPKNDEPVKKPETSDKEKSGKGVQTLPSL